MSRRTPAVRASVNAVVESLEARRLLANVPPGFTENELMSGLASPTSLAVLPDGRVLIGQQNGTVRLLKNDQPVGAPVVQLTVDSTGERGLLGMAVDPEFSVNPYIYIFYTATTPISHSRVSRFTMNGDVVVAGSELVLIDLPSVGSGIWRMGGGMHFGPDGKLYIGVGDQQDSSHSQSLSSPFGKILRLNPDGTIPTDNPFYNQTTGIHKAIWAYGLRNPYTSAFQPGTGLYYINDVGQDSWEEVNRGIAGGNYGWPATEGYTNNPAYVSPVYAFQHGADCAITGGAFYNPQNVVFPPQYVGKYFFMDFCAGWIKTLDPSSGQVGNFLTGAEFPNDMRFAPDGSLYYMERGMDTGGQPTTGKVFKVRYTANTNPSIISHPQSQVIADGEDATFSVVAGGPGTLSYQWRRDGFDIPGATGTSYTLESAGLSDHGAVFSVRVSNAGGSVTSNGATLTVIAGERPTATWTQPSPTLLYRGGDTIPYAADASDPEDGTLPPSAYTWRVDLHHDSHAHPFVAPVSGSASGSFVIPTVGETDPDVFYRIHLTVRDSSGLTFSSFRDVQPRKAQVTLNTNIPGMTLSLDGQPRTLPYTLTGVAGMTRLLTAAQQQTVNNVTYTFVSWSDGGAATHSISFPENNTTYTATYAAAAQPAYLSDLNPTSAINGWGPYERDRSNGETGPSDGGTITLNGVTFAKGLGVHALSDLRYNLAGQYARFQARVGLDDEVGSAGSVIFRVLTDGDVQLFTSGVMTGNSATQTIDVDITGRNVLRLLVETNGVNYDDHADWADAKVLPSGSPPPPPPPPPPSGIFAAPVSYATGTQSHGVTSGDFNGDGRLDLAVANAGSDNVSVLLGNGNATFAARINYAVGDQPKNVFARDLNNDGRLDLITANQGSATVSVLLGNGNGTFAPAVAYASPGGSHEAIAVDLNGDNRPDIAVVGWGDTVLRILMNNGNGTFAPGVNYGAGNQPHSVTSADFDGDGDIDLAVANWVSNNVSVFRNNGNGTFQSAITIASGAGPHSIRAADLNGDGRADLVTANDNSHNVSVFLGNGNGTFAAGVAIAVGRNPKSVAIGDVNKDGRLDIVTANSGGNYPNGDSSDGKKISVLLGNGNGTFGTTREYDTGHTPFSVTLGDFDADGDLDAATANWHSNDTTVLRNTTSDGATPNVPPQANDDAATTSFGQPVTIDVLANDTDSDGTLVPASVNVTTMPANGTVSVNPSNGRITYTPNSGFSGTDSFFYTVRDDDGALSNTARVNVTVSAPAPNVPPVANDDTASTTTGVAIQVNVLANDTDSDGTLVPSTVTVTTAPTNGTTAVNPTTGSITYTPASGFVGTDTFFYTVKDDDGATSNVAKVTVAVSAAPPPPTIVYLSDLNPTTQTNGWGPYERDRSNGEQGASDGGTITLNGVTFAKGLGVHAQSDLTFALAGQYSRFEARIGLDDEVGSAGSVVFRVLTDGGVQLFNSGAMTGSSATQTVNVDVTGRQTLRLIVDTNGNNFDDHADWGDAKLTRSGPPVPDTQAPTAPTNLRSPGKTSTSISLAWDASTDNVAVTGYDVYRDGIKVGTTTALGFTDSGLTSNTAYTYTIRAFDAIPNTSPPSAPLTVTTNPQGTTVYLSDLTPTFATNGWGPYERDRSNGETGATDGGPIRLNGVTYAKGLGVHAGSDIRYALNGQYTTFQAFIGVDDEVGNSGNVIFRVYADGVLIFDSGAMTGASATQAVNLSVAGRSELRLVVDSNGTNFDDHADWADAKLT
jgi:glucose/arabinose dehydrogenase